MVGDRTKDTVHCIHRIIVDNQIVERIIAGEIANLPDRQRCTAERDQAVDDDLVAAAIVADVDHIERVGVHRQIAVDGQRADRTQPRLGRDRHRWLRSTGGEKRGSDLRLVFDHLGRTGLRLLLGELHALGRIVRDQVAAALRLMLDDHGTARLASADRAGSGTCFRYGSSANRSNHCRRGRR